MACVTPLVLRTTVTNGQVTDVAVPPGMKDRAAPTVDDLLTTLARYGPDASAVTFNDVGVPLTMHLDHPDMTDDQASYQVTFTDPRGK